MTGTTIMVNINSICCNDSRHSRSASEMNSSSSAEEPPDELLVDEDGSESNSSMSELAAASTYDALFESDMVALSGWSRFYEGGMSNARTGAIVGVWKSSGEVEWWCFGDVC